MQRIDKENILALGYKDWIDKIESNNENHPEYSSKHEYYLDIVAICYGFKKAYALIQK